MVDIRIKKLRRAVDADPLDIDLRRQLELLEVRAGIRKPIYYNLVIKNEAAYLSIYDPCPTGKKKKFKRAKKQREEQGARPWRDYTKKMLMKKAEELGLRSSSSMTKEQLVYRLARGKSIRPVYSFYLGEIVRSDDLDPKNKHYDYDFHKMDWDIYFNEMTYIEDSVRRMIDEYWELYQDDILEQFDFTTYGEFFEAMLRGLRGEGFKKEFFPKGFPVDHVPNDVMNWINEDVPGLTLPDIPGISFELHDGERRLSTLFEEELAGSDETAIIPFETHEELEVILREMKKRFDKWFINSEQYNTIYYHSEYNPFISVECPE